MTDDPKARLLALIQRMDKPTMKAFSVAVGVLLPSIIQAVEASGIQPSEAAKRTITEGLGLVLLSTLTPGARVGIIEAVERRRKELDLN